MKLNIKTRVTFGFVIIVAVALLAIFGEYVELNRYVSAAGEKATAPLILAIISVLIIILITTGTLLYVRKALRDNSEKLVEYAGKLAAGETGFQIKAEGSDEFEPIYDALKEIAENNNNIVRVAESMAEGDFTVECKPRSEADLLGKALANLIEGNNEILSGIQESSYQLTTGAEQVAAASQALAQGSTEQASAVEEVTVSMKNIEGMTGANAKESNKASEIVSSTRNAARLGNERMTQMKAAMGEINDSSEKISKIIKVIDDISFQTNILALNAAVEAARAGAHGKGFAVVAEQIRELAGKSASAAQETADMIDDSIRKVHKGTKLADETEKALGEIMENINQVVDITNTISDSSNEQAVAISQVDQAMGQVSMVVQNNSATSQECAAAAEELSNQAQSLRQHVEKYKLTGLKAKSTGFDSFEFSSKPVRKFDFDENADPESIISLDGDFGKY